MKIIHYDEKEGEMKIAVDGLEDMWHLSKIIREGDEVEGSTFRTYKVGKTEEKKHVKIRIKTERVEFAEAANRLRVLGKIIWGEPEEFVQLGKHHTIDIAAGDKIKIKRKWMAHELKRLREAEKETKKPKLNVILLDEEHALLASIKPYGVDFGAEFHNAARKKSDDFDKKQEEYFKKLTEEIERFEGKTVVAGPGFAKDNLKKYITEKKPELLKKIIFESCSYAEPSGIKELINRGVIEKAVGLARFEKEEREVEDFFMHIYKETGKVVYGIEEVKKAVAEGAAEKILVIDSLFRTSEEIQKIIEDAEKTGTDVIVVAAEGDPGLKLKNFGGFGAILRWRI
ncbi:MAG: mRNA surveillance protein pelota [Candidatus Bilamarchaeaceae archaeon]